MLIRYSLPIGLNTCWTRSRSADSSSARTVATSEGETVTGRSYVARSGRDVLVAPEHVPGVVPALQRLQALERPGAEGGAHALERLVRRHVVRVPAAERPRLDCGRRLASPRDELLVGGGVL